VNKFEAETCAELSRSIVRYSDYYPFGFEMAGRADNSENYRYGFNGKEKDSPGMGGGGSTYDYGFRIYNPSIAKFLSVDPLTKSYPWYTPYQFAGNTPIQAIDIDGLEEASTIEADNIIRQQYEALTNTPGNPGFKPTQTITEYAIDIGNGLYRIYKSYTNLNAHGANEIDRRNQNGGDLRRRTEQQLRDEGFTGEGGVLSKTEDVYVPASYRKGVGQDGEYTVIGLTVTQTSQPNIEISEKDAFTLPTASEPSKSATTNGVYNPQNTLNEINIPLGSRVTLEAQIQTGENQGNSIQVNEGANTIMSTSGIVVVPNPTPLNPGISPVNVTPGGTLTITQQPAARNDANDIWYIVLNFNVTATQQSIPVKSSIEYTTLGESGYSGGYNPVTNQFEAATETYTPLNNVNVTVRADLTSSGNASSNQNNQSSTPS
jgi:RHS repeat-associated protein